ncbi:MAG TPA: hypothetical protein VGA50_04750 [Kiloniellales bacterium]
MSEADAQRLLDLFETGTELAALAVEFNRSLPETALALARALQARADRYATGGKS